jgi:peptidyl-prolyl cis-trans isomerase NIMA-interacting 1
VRCRHLLVKHCDSRRPSSWKEANITRTKAEAVQIVEGASHRYHTSTVLHSDRIAIASHGDPSVDLAVLTITSFCMLPLCLLSLDRAEFRSQIADGGITFEELASTESDCSSYKRGGDLGPFGRGKMQKEFEAAAYVSCFSVRLLWQMTFSNWETSL